VTRCQGLTYQVRNRGLLGIRSRPIFYNLFGFRGKRGHEKETKRRREKAEKRRRGEEGKKMRIEERRGDEMR
jgi:hypothetical protein